MIRYDMINIPIANIGGRPESPPHTRAHLQTDSLREKKRVYKSKIVLA